MEEQYDQAFLGILQHEGKIEPFLDAVIGFLYRRTDFFRILKGKDGKLGFPPGVALRMLASTFKKYEEMASRDEEQREAIKTLQEKKQQKAAKTEHKAEDEVKKEPTPIESQEMPCKPETQADGISNHSREHFGQSEVQITAKSSPAGSSQLPSSIENKEPLIDSKTGEEDDNPELTRQQQEFQSHPESYNGAVRDNYSWSQTITDLDLQVKVPSYVRKGRDVQVEIEKKHVRVRHKAELGGWVEAISGDLTWEVQKEESIWSLVPGVHVQINFEKKEERWWDSVMPDEPKINVRKIDASRPMTDLDEEAQAKIEEMMYNDRMKKMGKPQSHEQKAHDMLRSAWDAEGSPFKGQPFDPSKFSVDQSGMMTMKPS